MTEWGKKLLTYKALKYSEEEQWYQIFKVSVNNILNTEELDEVFG